MGFQLFFFFFFLLRISASKTSSVEVETVAGLSGVNRLTLDTALPLSFFFLSLNGVPPFPGFFSKLLILNSAASSGFFLLTALISLVNLVSYFYALRLFKSLFFLESPLRGGSLLVLEGVGANYIIFIVAFLVLMSAFLQIFSFETAFKDFWAILVYA